MSELTHTAPRPPEPGGRPGPATQDRPWVRATLVDLGIILGIFLVLGVVGALIWHQVTPLAEFTRTKDNAVMEQTELAKQFSTDGWFFVIAAVGGLVAGIVLTLWRTREPLVTVVAILLGAGLAAVVMWQLGLHLGPADPKGVIAHTKVGGHVPIRLKPTASGVFLVWPIAALFGSIGMLWGTSPHASRVSPGDSAETSA